MLDEVVAATRVVPTAKLADVAPAATVALAGTVADALLLASVTSAPPAGAAADRVTVPVELPPPTTEAGLTETDVSVAGAGVTVRVAELVAPPPEAEIWVVPWDATFAAVTMKAAVVAPARTVTLAGVVAAEVRLLARLTRNPPTGAMPFSWTVPVDWAPPWTLTGARASAETATRAMERTAVRVAPPRVAERVAEPLLVRGNVVTAKVAVVAPAATVTLAGTAAEALLLASVTTAPPAGAAADKVTVPVEPAPPTTEAGFTDTDASVATTGAPVSARLAVRFPPA